ncbi:MAG: ATP-dependent Clp protease adaptor ClpS [Bacteroidota bacterium]
MEFFCTEFVDYVVVDEKVKEIVLFNDDVNTFDYVIDSLQMICRHELTQAQQCAFLAHYTGKCSIKTGNYLDLEVLCQRLMLRGLSVEIQ